MCKKGVSFHCISTPFSILISYIVRIATITKHTLAIGPFILQKTEKTVEVDWGENSEE